MNTIIIIQGIVTMASVIGIVYYIFKYKNFYLKINKMISELEKPLRIGYYTLNCWQDSSKFGRLNYTALIHVYELDRYNNGDCKIKLKGVEIINLSSNNIVIANAINFIKNDFSSIRKESEITWLESVTTIKEQRKEKLNKLKTYLK